MTGDPRTTTGALGSAPARSPLCESCRDPERSGNLAAPEINEASGLAASRRYPNVYYVHNDSGDSARFFAIDASGADLGSYAVAGASAIDWEDMAIGPCGDPTSASTEDASAPATSCLYLADIGDNAAARTSYAVYRVPEPAPPAPGVHALRAEVFRFRYPDGAHNAETLLVHPLTGEVAVVTKVGAGASGIYAFERLDPNDTVTLRHTGDVAPPEGTPLLTAGDVHPGGRGVLLRSYSHLFFYAADGAEPLARTLARPPCAVPVGLELQGESVAFRADGLGWLSVSEGRGATLHAVSCAPAGR